MIRIMLVESDKLLCKEYALEIARDEEFALVAVTVGYSMEKRRICEYVLLFL